MSLNPLKVVPTLISIIRFSSYYGYSLCYGKYIFESMFIGCWHHQTRHVALTESRLFSRQLSGGFLSAFSHQPKKSRFPWEKVKAPSLDLKILQVFFKNRGEILVFKQMLNFLSFFVLLYVAGHFMEIG